MALLAEHQDFFVSDFVTFVVRPTTKAQVHTVEYDPRGRILYCLTYVDGDDVVKFGKFYGCELLAREE